FRYHGSSWTQKTYSSAHRQEYKGNAQTVLPGDVFEIEDFKMSQEHISILKGVAYGKLNSNLLIIERKKRLLKG
ncbi:MAG: hypothetical protein ACPGDB_03570, partial [Fusobacterium sp.]